MRYLLMATVAASALAIGIGFEPAAAFSPIGKTVGPEGVLHKVQHGERGTDAGKGKGNGSRRDGVRSGDGGRDHGRGTQFRSGTEMAIMAGEVRTSTFMSAPVTATSLIAIGCAVEPLRRVARIGGDATGHACN